MTTQHLLTERSPAHNTGLAKVAVQCSADTFVVKIATFAKPETVIANGRTTVHKTTDRLKFKH